MKVKINSHIVGFSQPPGTVLVVGEDITEEQAATLLSMGKEAEPVPEDPPDDPDTNTGNDASPDLLSGFPVAGQGNANNSLTVEDNGKKSAATGKGSKTGQAVS